MLKGKGTFTPLQRQLFSDLGNIPDINNFYLTGGTALAEFFLGHRHSYDLGLFTHERGLLIPFLTVLERGLNEASYLTKVIRRFESFVELQVEQGGENVQIHLAYDSPFRFEAPQPSEFGVNINNYKDITVDKLLTFFGRWTHRDAIDLFFILKKESIDNLLGIAKQKDPGFDLYWFAVALNQVEDFPDDIEKWPVDMLIEVDAEELKKDFLNLSQYVMGKIKKG